MMIYVLDREENIMGKGQNAGYHIFKVCMAFNPDNKILDWSKLKRIADNILKGIQIKK